MKSGRARKVGGAGTATVARPFVNSWNSPIVSRLKTRYAMDSKPAKIILIYETDGVKVTVEIPQLGVTIDEFLNEHIKPFMIAAGWSFDTLREIELLELDT
jgi:hypothetical protein